MGPTGRGFGYGVACAAQVCRFSAGIHEQLAKRQFEAHVYCVTVTGLPNGFIVIGSRNGTSVMGPEASAPSLAW